MNPLVPTLKPSGTKSSTVDVSVIVPTYCEADNLSELVPRVFESLSEAQLSCEIIIVDDNSPDSTREVCKELEQLYPLRLEVRQHERGLSTAVIHGMRLAVGQILVCMDADLSHPPEKVPELVAKMEDADFVIGSRYVSGGTTDDKWGFLRWLNSRVATWLAWPLTTASDPMAGFFALRRTKFHSTAQLDPVGYKIGLELIVKCDCKRLEEVPIHFRDRLHGTSKLTFREQLNYLIHIKRLLEYRCGDAAFFLQFIAVGATGMTIDLCCYAVMMSMLPVTVARCIAIALAMNCNFALNRAITFSYARKAPAMRQWILFCLSCSLGAIVNWSVSIGLYSITEFFGQHVLFAAVIGIAAGTITNFCLCRYVVFRKPHAIGPEAGARTISP